MLGAWNGKVQSVAQLFSHFFTFYVKISIFETFPKLSFLPEPRTFRTFRSHSCLKLRFYLKSTEPFCLKQKIMSFDVQLSVYVCKQRKF